MAHEPHLERARHAILAWDSGGLDRIVATLGDDTAGWAGWARAWASLLRGEWTDAHDRAATLETDASARKDAALVIESAALRALAAAYAGETPRALVTARRASRMARTEAIPEQEYVAHLALAHVRRLTGHPHLATRILGALAQAAPPPFYGWLRWELVMAGALETAQRLAESMPSVRTSSAEAAAALEEIVGAAESCDVRRWDAARAVLDRHARSPMIAADAGAVLDACDLERTPRDTDVIAWCAGATAEGPSRLHGILTRRGSAPPDDSAIAYVIAHPHGERRRIPRLVWSFSRTDGVVVLAQGRRKQGRVETLVSALALAGDGGLDETDCFAEVYEFVYEPEVHKNIFHVLVHRAREWLGDAGTVEVGGGRISLRLERPVLVPDPRCTKPMQDRLLRAVAENRGATAKDIARAIGVSLRVAQAALQELSADGACLAQREGKQVRYVVEDTTFSEPTQL